MDETAPTKRELTQDDLRRLARALGLYVLRDKLAPEELAARLPDLELLSYPEGQAIVSEGAASTGLFIISRGSAVVTKAGQQLARLAAGDIFGEVAFASGAPRPRVATVTAGEGCEVFRCETAGFADLAARHPALLDCIRKIAASRLKKLAS